MAAVCKYIVVGGGIAGVSCAEQLSQNDPTAIITVVSASNLIKAVTNFHKLTKRLESFDVEERSTSHLTKTCPNVSVIIAEMLSVNYEEHTITLHDKHVLKYDKLCLCLGACPKLICKDNPAVFGIRDTESVKTLQDKLKWARRVIIIGNGGIATELVYELSGCQVVWVIKDGSIGSTFFDEGAATFFLPHLTTPHHSSNTDTSSTDISTGANDTTANDIPTGANDVTATDGDSAVVTQSKPLKRMRYLLDPVDISHGSGAAAGFPSTVTHGSALGPDWGSTISVTGSSENKYYRHVHVEYNSELSGIITSHEMDTLNLTKTPLDIPSLEPTTTAVTTTSWPYYVQLSNGKVYGCDFIVSATGVTPNIEPLNDIIDKVNISSNDGGILVDCQMRTSLPDVYAAGDICTTNWSSTSDGEGEGGEYISRTWFQMRLWSQARQMGAYAANCMTAHTSGKECTLDFCFELFAHVTKFFGYKVVLLGLYNAQGLGSDYELLLRTTKGVEYIKVILQNGRMVGAVLIGDTDLEETFENLILNQMDLSMYGEGLLDPNVDIEDYFD